MNKKQLERNVGRRLRFRPEPTGWHGEPIENLWLFAQTAHVGGEFVHIATRRALILAHDHVHEYMTDTSGGSDGFLVLHVHVVQDRDWQFTALPIVPRINLPPGVQLTLADYEEAARLIRELDEGVKRMVRDGASPDSREMASNIQTETRDWIAGHVGPAMAASFMARGPTLSCRRASHLNTPVFTRECADG